MKALIPFYHRIPVDLIIYCVRSRPYRSHLDNNDDDDDKEDDAYDDVDAQ